MTRTPSAPACPDTGFGCRVLPDLAAGGPGASLRRQTMTDKPITLDDEIEAVRKIVVGLDGVVEIFPDGLWAETMPALRSALTRLEASRWEQLVDALRYHINHEMDQWEMWRMTDRFGNPVYIKISHYPHVGVELAAYNDLDAPPATTSKKDSDAR